MDANQSDVLILGGGVIGLACALALLRRGVSVRVLERAAAGAGASHGNCGTLTPSHAIPLNVPGMPWQALRWMARRDAPLYVNPKPDWERWRWLLGFARRCNRALAERSALARAAILLRSASLFPSWLQTEGIDCEYTAEGNLHVYRTAKLLARDQRDMEWLHWLGVAAEAVSAADTLALEPALLPGVVGGIVHPDDAQLRPDKLVAGLARRVVEAGGELATDAEVQGFQHEGKRITGVATTHGEFAAARVILALGAWTPKVARGLELEVPIQPGKGYSITMSRPDPCPRRAVVLREAGVCVTPWASGYRLGSTMEFSGYDTTLNPTRIEALRRGARAYLKAPLGAEVQEEWWGWRPMCIDELPLIGPSSRWSNLLFATGHGMLGVSMSVATAELVAACVMGDQPVLDAAAYAPARFGL